MGETTFQTALRTQYSETITLGAAIESLVAIRDAMVDSVERQEIVIADLRKQLAAPVVRAGTREKLERATAVLEGLRISRDIVVARLPDTLRNEYRAAEDAKRAAFVRNMAN